MLLLVAIQRNQIKKDKQMPSRLELLLLLLHSLV
jgi:hypothetical protein